MSPKPKLIVFDLDYTLWPFWVDTHFTPPFHKGKNGEIRDRFNNHIKCYPEVPDVLQKLYNDGYQIGIASRTGEIEGAHQLISLFGWKDLFSYKEIYPGTKVSHFSKIKSKSGIPYEAMIFFDDEHRNIDDLTREGVLSILVKNGLTWKVVNEGLEQYARKYKSKS